MSVLTWDESYAVGVELLDQQHKILIQLINRFDNAAKAQADTAELTNIFSQVLDYTTTHFTMEELMMKQAKYPDLENHMGIHARLVEEAKKHYEEIKAGSKGANQSAMNFLGNWLEKHIKGIDTKYGPYMQENAA